MRAHPRAADKRNACTHTRVEPVFHVFTLGRVAAGVTCARLHTRTQANTEAARWRLSATQMCMRAWRVYTSLSCARPRVRKYAVSTYTRANTYAKHIAPRQSGLASVGAPLISFRFDKVARKNGGNFVSLARNAPENRSFFRVIFRIAQENCKSILLFEPIANFPFYGYLASDRSYVWAEYIRKCWLSLEILLRV